MAVHLAVESEILPAPLFSGVFLSRRGVQSKLWTVKKAGSAVRNLWFSEIARSSFSERS
jgi:hypothetical protein